MTRLVVYNLGSGAIKGYDQDYTIDFRTLTPDGSGFGVDGEVLGICSTQDNPEGKTNISQMAVTIINPADFVADPAQGVDKKQKAIIMGLVDVINVRLPAGQKIKADELKAAIKARMQ